jgi:hypothetical protein
MNKKLLALVVIAAASNAAIAENSLQTVFSDSEFNSADWFYEVGAVGGGAGFSTQELTGGNPGAYRLINLSMTAGEGGVGLHAFKYSAVYNPSTQGAIASVAFSEDLRMVVGSMPGMSSGSVLLQNGLRYYRWCWETDSVSWTNRTASGVGAESYHIDGLQDDGTNPLHPDFSANGAAITFGYFRNIQGIAGTDFFMTSGVDNWTTTVVAVPEPSIGGLFLLGLGTVFLACKYRRKQRSGALCSKP